MISLSAFSFLFHFEIIACNGISIMSNSRYDNMTSVIYESIPFSISAVRSSGPLSPFRRWSLQSLFGTTLFIVSKTIALFSAVLSAFLHPAGPIYTSLRIYSFPSLSDRVHTLTQPILFELRSHSGSNANHYHFTKTADPPEWATS